MDIGVQNFDFTHDFLHLKYQMYLQAIFGRYPHSFDNYLRIITSLIARFMGPIWGRQDPGGPHVGPMDFASWDWHKSDAEIIHA